MNDHSSSAALHAMVFLSDSIFSGLKILVAVLFFLQFIRTKKFSQQQEAAARASNTLLLTGGILFLITIIANTTRAWLSGNESERDMIISFATGSHWYQFIIPVFNYGVLPNIMWLIRFRKSINISFILVTWWLMSSYIISEMIHKNAASHSIHSSHTEFPLVEYAEKIIVFALLFLIIYQIIRKKQKHMIPENADSTLL